MPTHIKQITETLKCSKEHATNVEKYIDNGNMLNWTAAHASLVNTITKAVSAKLMRDTPVKRKSIIVQPTAPASQTPKPKAPKTGTKIAHALVIYNEMQVNGVRSSRQDIISAMSHSMQIEKKAAAGYYQSCKKKVGA